MTVHVPDRFKAANASWIGLAKIGLTPAAVLSQGRLPLTVYYGKKNLVTTAQFMADVSCLRQEFIAPAIHCEKV